MSLAKLANVSPFSCPGRNARTLTLLDLSGNLLDGAAVATLCEALLATPRALETLDVSANRLCVGEARRAGFERETFHSRKRGGSHRSKLYLDYVHAAWVPDLRGVHALVALAEGTPSLTSLDARSNALTVDAGEILAPLLDTARHLSMLCGVPLSKLQRRDVTKAPLAVLALGPDLDATHPLVPDQAVEARFQGGRRFYPATVTAVREEGVVDLAYVDAANRVVRREINVPRRFVREANAGPPRRLEAGGAVVLAAALQRARADALGALEEVRLPHQSLAFDMTVWNPPPQHADRSKHHEPTTSRAHDTGINPAGALRLVEALRACPNLVHVDWRDTLDAGSAVGAALAAAARERSWKTLGLGACVLDVDDLARTDHAKLRRSLKDAGVAAVAELCCRATHVTVSTTAVSSSGLQRLIDAAAARPRLQHVNGLDLRLLLRPGAAQVVDLDLSAAHLNRASARMVLSLLGNCERLESLNLSNADLMPSAHPHPMTPELFGNGHLCNACATHHALNVDLNLACQVCDNDACGAAWRSNDIVDDLAGALRSRGETLRHLTLKNCCFTTMDGPIAVVPFDHLGDVLGDHLPKLVTVDLSGNEWSAPRLTRWCAESLNEDGADGDAAALAAAENGDDDDEMRWNRRARLWQRVVELESSASDDDRNDDDRAYSRKRLPVAAGFPALARGLARNPSLRKATVSSRATVDLAKVRTARRAYHSEGGGATEAVVDARTFFVVEALTKQDDDDDDDFWTNPHVDLANLLLLLDAVGVAAAARPETFPRRLRVDLRGMPALCLGTAQRALIDAFPSLDVLQVGALDLDLAALRSGAAAALRLAPPRTARPEEALKSNACGLLVAAAIRSAKRLVEVDARGVDLGDAAADVARAARDHAGLTTFNGVTLTLTPRDTVLSFANERIGDAGALLLGRELERSGHAIDAIDLSNCALSPVGVAALFHGLATRGAAPTRAANPRKLDLSLNDVGELGVRSLATYLRADTRLEALTMRAAQLPRSTTAAMEALALAFEVNAHLVCLDVRDAHVPAKVAHALRRTLEKKPTAPMPLDAKRAFLLCLARNHKTVLDEDSLKLVFAFARNKRKLRLDARDVDALADLFPLNSPEARDLVDKMESGDFDISNEDDLAEINAVLARLDERDQRSVTRSYWVLRSRAAAADQQDQDLANFVQQQMADAGNNNQDDDDDDDDDDDSDDDDMDQT